MNRLIRYIEEHYEEYIDYVMVPGIVFNIVIKLYEDSPQYLVLHERYPNRVVYFGQRSRDLDGFWREYKQNLFLFIRGLASYELETYFNPSQLIELFVEVDK